MSQARCLRVAILGAGIMGSATALFLARRGCTVVLYDRAESAVSGASRWNEGKIHLGFLYAADRTLRTAGEVLPGGMSFKPLAEELIGTPIDPATTPQDDIYLVHPNSVVSAENMGEYFARVAQRAGGYDGQHYLAPITPVRKLSRRELLDLTDALIVAGFRVPERSVNTLWLADRMVEALAAEPGVELRTGHRVERVAPTNQSWDGPWRVLCDAGSDDGYDVVINALWEGRLAIDTLLGIQPTPGWSHRFRLSLFAKTGRRVALSSAVLAAGPFGDVKSYDGHSFYLSWYPAGLAAEGGNIAPPDLYIPPAEQVIDATRDGLTAWLPPVRAVFDNATSIEVGGGWVFAQGKGSLADPGASVHRRDNFGIRRMGTYFSVDTGKYSCAPWLARRLTAQILDG